MSWHKLAPFWINPVYDGTTVDDQLIEAVRQMWPEAVHSTERCLGDVSRAAEIMETAVHIVCTKSLQGSIEDFSLHINMGQAADGRPVPFHQF